VQYGGSNTFMIHAHVGKDLGNSDRVVDVRLPGFSGLPLMSRVTDFKGPQDYCDLFGVKISV
jgi:hypothetical protein